MPGSIGRGVVVPILTPFNDDLSIATTLYVEHAQRLFEEGCAGLAPFGTTGEALSVGIDERINAIRHLIDGGIDPARLIPGTGLSNLADTVRLSRACLDMGCAAVMTLPPFYFKNVSDEGLYEYFARLIETLGDDARLVLYHIPPIAIVGISPALAARLYADFPNQVVGIKDSSGDWDNTALLFDIDGLIVYPGSEVLLFEALVRGGPGCISATANINGKSIAEVIALYDSGDTGAAQANALQLRELRQKVDGYGPIPAQKWLLAKKTGDARWANVRPPLLPLAPEKGRELAAKLDS